VVADEVRKLTEQSSTVAREIASLVADIQAASGGALAAMEIGVEEAEIRTVRARKAAVALTAILSAIDAVSQQLTGIAADADAMTAHVAYGAGLVEDVAAVAEESAASAEGMTHQSDEMARSIRRLACPTASGSERDDRAEGSAEYSQERVFAGRAVPPPQKRDTRQWSPLFRRFRAPSATYRQMRR
jgi:hypothetical protein